MVEEIPLSATPDLDREYIAAILGFADTLDGLEPIARQAVLTRFQIALGSECMREFFVSVLPPTLSNQIH